MTKKKTRTNKGKKYDKPISLYPIPFEQAVTALLSVPQPKKERKNKQNQRIKSR